MNKFICKIVILLQLLLIILPITGCDKMKDLSNTLINPTAEQIKDMHFLGSINNKNLEWFEECVDDGVDLNKINGGFVINGVLFPSNINPAKQIMITLSDDKMLNYLFEHGADADYVDSDGNSLLMLAAGASLGRSSHISPNIEFIKILIENGADVNKKNTKGSTALDYAVYSGYMQGVEFLFESGAWISDNTIKTLMEHNNYRGIADYSLKKLVLENAHQQNFAIDINPIIKASILGDSQTVIKSLSETALSDETIKEILFSATAFCNDNALQKIVDTGVDFQVLNGHGNGVLQIAASNGNFEGVKFWIAQGLPVRRNGYSDNPLLVAIKNNHYNVAEYLFQQGENLSLEDLRGDANFPWVVFNNPMDDIINNGSIAMVELLIDNGYPMIDDTISHAVQKAIEFHQVEMLNYFLDKGIDLNYVDQHLHRTFLETACQFDNNEAAKLLIEKGANADGFDTSVPLLNAVLKGNVEIVKLLIDNGADVNRIREFEDGSTSDSALMTATQNGYFNIIKLLIENEANLEYKCWDSEDTVILTTASTSNCILQYFIGKGADINYQNANGETALMRAVSALNKSNIKLLLNSGADLTLKNSEGLTALDIAKKINNKELQSLLESVNK